MSWVILWLRYTVTGAVLIGLQVVRLMLSVMLLQVVNLMSHVSTNSTVPAVHMTKTVHKAVVLDQETQGFVTPPFLSQQLHSIRN